MRGHLVSILKATVAIAGLVFTAPAWADRLVTDQIGRDVHVPDAVIGNLPCKVPRSLPPYMYSASATYRARPRP